MRERGWLFTTLFSFLVNQGLVVLLLAWVGESFSRPELWCGFLGLLLIGYLVLFFVQTDRGARLSGPGCLVLLAGFLVFMLMIVIAWVVELAGFSAEALSQAAAVLFAVVVLLVPGSCCGTMLEHGYYQGHVARTLECDLGFQTDTNTLEGTWPTGRKYIFVTCLQAGGLAERAGLMPHDIIIDEGSFTAFWRQLQEARGGQPITIHVAAWSDPGPVSKRPTRQIPLCVPPANYRTALERELGFRCEVNYFKELGRWLGVLVVKDIRPGSVMAEAGFQERDVILDAGGAPDFFGMLEESRGGPPVEVEVVPWIDPPDIAQRPARELLLGVPPRDAEPASGRFAALARSLWRPCEWGIQKELERELGFHQGWERLPKNGVWQGTPTIERLESGGVLAQAGAQEKDILLEGFSFPGRWEKARGRKPILVRVAPWIEPPPLRTRPRRLLAIRVPMAQVGHSG